MNNSTKIALGITGGILLLAFVGVPIVRRFYNRQTQSGGGLFGGGNDAPQSTINSAQAKGIADALYNEWQGVLGVNYGGLEDTITILNPIQNQQDWNLIVNAYGVRDLSIGSFLGTYHWVGDIVSSMKEEFSDSELQQLRNFFASKNINVAI